MALYYQTEYRLGRHKGKIHRIYTGFPAFLAIATDLFLVFTFELMISLLGMVLKNLYRLLLIAVTTVLLILATPFRVAYWLLLKLERRPRSVNRRYDYQPTNKPAWAGYQEV